MRTAQTYFIRRGGVDIWLSHNESPREGDTVIEERTMLVADEGRTLVIAGEEVGGCVWVRDGETSAYTEWDIPEELEEEE